MGKGVSRRTLAAIVLAFVVPVATLLPMRLFNFPSGQRAAAASATSRFGVFAGNANVQRVDALGRAIGVRPNYVMVYLNGRTWQTLTDPSGLLSRWEGTNYQLIWDVPMLPQTGGAQLSSGATGELRPIFRHVGHGTGWRWTGQFHRSIGLGF